MWTVVPPAAEPNVVETPRKGGGLGGQGGLPAMAQVVHGGQAQARRSERGRGLNWGEWHMEKG